MSSIASSAAAASPASDRAPQFPADRLEPFVDVRVEERIVEADGLAERPVVTVGPSCQREVRQVAGQPKLFEAVRDHPLAIDAEAFCPEPAGHLDAPHADRRESRDRGRRRQRAGDGSRDPRGDLAGLRHACTPVASTIGLTTPIRVSIVSAS